MNFSAFVRAYWCYSFLPAGALIGLYFDRRNARNLSTFRHKSKLFQGEQEAKNNAS